MTASKTIKLSHPDSKQVIEVAVEHQDAYLSQGWVEKGQKAEDVPPSK